MEDGDDAEYQPVLDASWIAGNRIGRLLVTGDPDDETARELTETFDDVRVVNTFLAGTLPRGTYLFAGARGQHGVLALRGSEPAQAESGRLRYSDNHLAGASELFDRYWSEARTLLPGAPFAAGDLVHELGQGNDIGVVVEVRRHARCHEIIVDVRSDLRTFAADGLVRLDGDPRDPKFWLERPPASADDIALTLSWLRLNNPLTDMLYSFAATRTTFKPYQFIPVLKLLRSSTGRLLIADEVGLGKTIEAGLIWTELEQREPIRRALVIVPSALRFKWQDEMRRRFMRSLPLLTPSDLSAFVSEVERGYDPEIVGIISIESIRTAGDLLERLVELKPDFQLVIVDEAHVLRNRGIRSYDVGQAFSELADTLVFLSATPLNLGESDLFNLINVLDPEGFPDSEVFEKQLEPNRTLNAVARDLSNPTTRNPTKALWELKQVKSMEYGGPLSRRPDYLRLEETLQRGNLSAEDVARSKRLLGELNTLGQVFTRTRKVDVPDQKAQREAHSIEVTWTQEERRYYEAVYEYYRRRASISRQPTGFIMQMPLRMACSSLPVLQRRIARREGWMLSDEADELSLESDADRAGEATDLPDDMSVDEILSRPLTVDSKLEALIEHLRAAQGAGSRQALIFTFFRGTVEYLVRMLSARGIRAEGLHGGISQGESRQAVIDRFARGDFDVLVANQVGSEGLDFQFCNVLVNYDLPWNPMQVEQRIGRLDRFGQQSEKIFIFNLVVPGTIETDIYARLYYRIGVFERSIGDLEPILRSEIEGLNSLLLNPALTPAEREKEIDRWAIAMQRREAEIHDLEDATGLLSSLSQLDVEGLGPSGPRDGRYVGTDELKRMLEFAVTSFGGSIHYDSEGARIAGSGHLARAVRELPYPELGTDLRRRLPQHLRDGSTFNVAFVSSTQSIDGDPRELITSRHPLIRLAIATLSETPLRLPRFGGLAIDGIGAGRRYLIQFDLVQSRGATPLCELWPTAIDMSTGERDESVEARVLEAFAGGDFVPLERNAPPPTELGHALESLRAIVADRYETERSQRMRENDALVDARVASRRDSLARKRARAEETVAQLRRDGRDPRAVRLWEAKAAIAREREDDLSSDADRLRVLGMSRTHGALLIVEGRS